MLQITELYLSCIRLSTYGDKHLKIMSYYHSHWYWELYGYVWWNAATGDRNHLAMSAGNAATGDRNHWAMFGGNVAIDDRNHWTMSAGKNAAGTTKFKVVFVSMFDILVGLLWLYKGTQANQQMLQLTFLFFF